MFETKTFLIHFRLVGPLALLLSLCGCNTNFSGNLNMAPPASIALTVSPVSASLAAGQSLQFAANVSGDANTAVSWSVNGVAGGTAAAGTITSGGLYRASPTAQSATKVTITAVSLADGNKSASATITIQNQISINPVSATLSIGETQLFAATLNGLDISSVLWSVAGIPGGNAAVGTISTSGLYSAPAVAPSSPVIVTASDASFGARVASATLTITDPALINAHNQWLSGVAEIAATYGCSPNLVQQAEKQSVTEAIADFGALATEGTCLILWPISTDPDSMLYSLAWGGTVNGKDILYISDVSQLRIWNSVDATGN